MKTAVKLKDLKTNWYSGTALYRVNPSIEVKDRHGHLTQTRFVIAAVTPRASDHGKPETKLFAARSNGRLFDPNGDVDSFTNDLGIAVVGKKDHSAAFAKLQGGYKIVGDTVKQTEIARGYVSAYGHNGKAHSLSVFKSPIETSVDNMVFLKIPKRVRADMFKRKYRVIVEPIETKGKK